MKVLVVLVAGLILGVCAKHKGSTPSGDSSEEAVLLGRRIKYPARVISSYGLSSHLVGQLRRALEKLYNPKDSDQELANKLLTKAYEILDYPVTVFVKTVDGYSRSLLSFSVELKIDSRDVYIYG